MKNQAGQEVFEQWFNPYNTPSKEEMWQIMCLIMDTIGVEAYLTNVTKHGTTEIVLKKNV
jgi:hypothetical protein